MYASRVATICQLMNLYLHVYDANLRRGTPKKKQKKNQVFTSVNDSSDRTEQEEKRENDLSSNIDERETLKLIQCVD